MIQNHVLDHRTESNRMIDFRLLFFFQVDALRVASPLNIEHTVVGPAVFVIPDQLPRRVGRQGRLSGSGQSEEHRRLPGLRIHIGRAVHRQHIVFHRQHVIHDRKYGFLNLSRIAGSGNDDEMGLVIDDNRRFRMNAVLLRIAFEPRHRQDGEIRLAVFLQLFLRRTNQQVVDEQVLPRFLVDNPNFPGVLAVCTGKTIENEHFFPVQILDHIPLNPVKNSPVNRAINVSPMNPIVHRRAVYNVFIVRRSAGILSRFHRKGARRGQGRFPPLQGFLHQSCRAQIVVHLTCLNTQLIDSVHFHNSLLL